MRAHSAYDKMSYESKNAISASFYPDTQELLCAADVLLTDYSSSIWNFGLTSKPCFLFAPDLEKYETSDRGFYTPILEWPGILVEDNDSLINAIENFDEESYKLKLEKHYEK